MKWWIAGLGMLLAGSVLVLGLEIGGLRGQLGQARIQIAKQQQDSQRIQVRFEGELAAERAAFAQAESRIGGTHRDLITCADWQSLYLPVSGSDSFGGQLAASAGPASLPAHCINQ